ncbi:MAG: hypothetical protein AB7P22_09765 [Vicinamibacterales bacterium]
MHISPEAGWLPARIGRKQGYVQLLLGRLEGRCPTAPSLEMDLLESTEQAAVELGEALRGRTAASAQPAGFIFHMSRTGSTVTGSMLRAADVAFVSEPLAVNDLFFRLDGDELLDEQLKFIIDWFVTALGGSRRVVFKFSSWVSLHLDRFERLYPSVPRVFMYREPVEVVSAVVNEAPFMFRRELVRSLFRSKERNDPAFEQRMLHALRGQVDYGRDCTYVEFVARFIGSICEPPAAAYATGRPILPINYATFKRQVIEEMAPAFGIQIDDSRRRQMLDAAQYDGKTRERIVFTQDATLKRQAATPLMTELSAQYIQPSIDIFMDAVARR